jgi:hypothetical protein
METRLRNLQVNDSAYEIRASGSHCRESEGSVKHGDGGNPGLGCGANNRRSQFFWISVAIHDIKTDLDRRKKFLPVIAGEFPHERVGGSDSRSDGQEPIRIVKQQDHGIEFDWGVPFHDTILPMGWRIVNEARGVPGGGGESGTGHAFDETGLPARGGDRRIAPLALPSIG